MFRSRGFFIVVSIALIILSSPIAYAKYSGGSGTASDPYKIANAADLLALAADTNDYNKCFILTADIDLASYSFTTAVIAPDTNNTNGSFEGTIFTGTFDGTGHKISNPTINTNGAGNDYLGLFGYVWGEIKNLGLENVSITGGNRSLFIGGLVGSIGICGISRINNCYSTGAITAGDDSSLCLGGLVGSNSGTISDCFSTVNLSAGNSGGRALGGLVGGNGRTIINCYSTGNINGKGYYFGGLVGENHGGSISNCYSTGAVTGIDNSTELGGLVGGNYGTISGNGSVSNCYSTGTVTGGDDSWGLGGLVGCNEFTGYNATINNCYSKGAVTGGDGARYLGGLVGGNSMTISNCFSTGAVTGGDNSSELGGLVGSNGGGGNRISSCYFLVTSGPDNGYGESLTDAQMKQQSSFVGWDFDTIWDIIENETYPFLGVFPRPPAPRDPSNPDIPSMPECIEPREPGVNKIIYIVHGWDFPLWPFKEDWMTDMKTALEGVIDMSQWQVEIWDWMKEAHQLELTTVFGNAVEQGKLLAERIGCPNHPDPDRWQHVHLIGFSAGAVVINTAAIQLFCRRTEGKFSGDIHLTFLDPLAPYWGEKTYGSTLDFRREWAENYFNTDMTDFLLSWTSGKFKYAHNVDLTPVGGIVQTHTFPHEWYYATITGYYPDGLQLGNDNLYNGIRYGFPRTLEAGEPNWLESLGLPVGNDPVVISGTIDEKIGYESRLVPVTTQPFADSYVVQSVTGIKNISSDGIRLFTDSPVWVHILVEMPMRTNYVKFTYQFEGAGDGYLTAYFNENLVLIGDQRFDSNQPHDSGEIMVADIMQDNNWLTFRLDPIGEEQASIFISNVEVGSITITNQIQVVKCTVAAGSKENSDAISISGLMDASADDFSAGGLVEVTIDSNDMVNPCVQTFPINDKTFKKGKYKCTITNKPLKTSFAFDTRKSKFSFSAKNTSLKGLSCPLNIEIRIGDYVGAAEVNEAIVNGKKPIPIKLMMGVKNSLRIDKIRVKHGTKLNSDYLSVKGGFAVQDVNVNMADVNFVAELQGQRFTIPAGKFKAGKGKFTCSKVKLNEGGVAAANFNFKTCTFTLAIKETEIMAVAGTADFKIKFGDFDEGVTVNLGP
jgi:hypothetical protein